jgi:hypothetical protein
MLYLILENSAAVLLSNEVVSVDIGVILDMLVLVDVHHAYNLIAIAPCRRTQHVTRTGHLYLINIPRNQPKLRCKSVEITAEQFMACYQVPVYSLLFYTPI